MIDLTPLDVRNKRGDFKKILRGYEPQEVDVFLELVAERLEQLVRENIALRERSSTLEQQVSSQSGREQAVQDALVTAQELRTEIQTQAKRESDHILHEADTEARRRIAEAEAEVRKMLRDAERKLELGQDALEEMERRRTRFLKSFRQLLEREMDVVEVEEERAPLEDRPIDLDLGSGRFGRASLEEDAAEASTDSQDPSESPVQLVEDDFDGENAEPVEDGLAGESAGESDRPGQTVDADVHDSSPVDEFSFDDDAAEGGPEADDQTWTTDAEAHAADEVGQEHEEGESEGETGDLALMPETEEEPEETREPSGASFFSSTAAPPDVPTLDEVLSESEPKDDTLAFPFDSDESDGDRWG